MYKTRATSLRATQAQRVQGRLGEPADVAQFNQPECSSQALRGNDPANLHNSYDPHSDSRTRSGRAILTCLRQRWARERVCTCLPQGIPRKARPSRGTAWNSSRWESVFRRLAPATPAQTTLARSWSPSPRWCSQDDFWAYAPAPQTHTLAPRRTSRHALCGWARLYQRRAALWCWSH